MLDLDIFEENVFEAVANNAMSKFLPTNADEFFDWYIGIYAKEHSCEYNLTEEKINMISDFKKYVKVVNKSMKRTIAKPICVFDVIDNKKVQVMTGMNVNYEYFENEDKDFYEGQAAWLIRNMVDYNIILKSSTETTDNDPISEAEFLKFMLENAELLIPEPCGYSTRENYVNRFKDCVTYYTKFRKMTRSVCNWKHNEYVFSKNILIKSTISSPENFKKIFSNIIYAMCL